VKIAIITKCAGHYWVFSEKGTFITSFEAAPNQPLNKTLWQDLVVHLKTGVTVSGRVLYKGQPATGASLKFYRTITRAQSRTHHFVGPAKTRIDGTYEFNGLEPESTFYVEIVDSRGNADPEWRYGATGSGRIPTGETELRLPDVSLLSFGQSLRGIVVDPKGKPVSGVTVSARLQTGQSLRRTNRGVTLWTESTADGKFELNNLPESPIQLMAYIKNPKGGPILFPSHVQPSINQQDIRIVYDPSLAGEVDSLDPPKKQDINKKGP
jgi:Carboxypeptidase regulatory-like domain